jgi:hypothetical protein
MLTKRVKTKKAPDFFGAFLITGNLEKSNEFIDDFYKVVNFYELINI